MVDKIKINIPEKCMFLLTDKARYKVLYGGRGSAKTESVGRALIIEAMKRKIRVLCARQTQASMSDSVHRVLCDIIHELGLEWFFTITRDSIRGINGSDFFFKGIKQNVAEIKSTKGVNICWCFLAGTKIDGKNIEDIKKGDFVYSYNHKKNKIEKRKVLKIMKRKAPDKIFRLTYAGTNDIFCTAEHPFYVKNKGYIEAKDLKIGDICYAKEKRFTGILLLFRWLWGKDCDKYSREKTDFYKKGWYLLQRLCSRNESKKIEGKKSNGQRNWLFKYDEKKKRTNCFRRKWSRLYTSAKTTLEKIRTWMVGRIYSSDSSKRWRSDTLQNRFSKLLLWNCHRIRWWFTQRENSSRRRQKEKYVLGEQRVESIKIQEQRSVEKYRFSDGGDYVYNIEVEGNNNYFANGILVHNCEEADAITQESWDVLIPTIREPDSEIWITFNPNMKSDATYQNFVVNKPDNCISVEMNYDDNPFFPEVLREEMEFCKKINYPKYEHIWLGIPNAEAGNLIKMNMFKRYILPPERFDGLYIVCDTAFSEKKSADNSAFMMMGVKGKDKYILDVYCKRVTFVDLCRDLKSFYLCGNEKYGRTNTLSAVYIENKASGISLTQQLRAEGLPIMEIYPTVHNEELKKDIVADKYTRFLEIEAELYSGNVWLPESAPWMPEFERQSEAFTGGKQDEHDDIVDTLIYGLKVSKKYGQTDWGAFKQAFRR